MFILVTYGPSVGIVPITLSGNDGNKNPSDRLAEIRSKIAVAEQRVRDLEGLLTGLILGNDDDPGTPGNQIDFTPGDGIINQLAGLNTPTNPNAAGDANAVRQELYRARAYEGELRTAESFWNEIVSANKSAEQKTHELFKPAGG